MKLIIDIDGDIITAIKENRIVPKQLYTLFDSIVNGTPLPKGHGRLIDADKIANEINALKDNWNRYGNEYESGRYESYDYAVDMIDEAPTIIEADKAESEDRE